MYTKKIVFSGLTVPAMGKFDFKKYVVLKSIVIFFIVLEAFGFSALLDFCLNPRYHCDGSKHIDGANNFEGLLHEPHQAPIGIRSVVTIRVG